jgi:ribonuclease HI
MTNSNTSALAGQAPTTNGDQPHDGQTHIEIYTDGSCIGNPGHGGYGVVILRRDNNGAILNRRERSGFELSTTNIRMEMIAACAAIESLGRVTDEPITVFCDANLIPNAMNGWLANWKAKGWKKSDGKIVVNQDLWERLEAAAKGRNVTWAWVRGHNGNEHNERADRLAYAGSLKAEAKLLGR